MLSISTQDQLRFVLSPIHRWAQRTRVRSTITHGKSEGSTDFSRLLGSFERASPLFEIMSARCQAHTLFLSVLVSIYVFPSSDWLSLGCQLLGALHSSHSPATADFDSPRRVILPFALSVDHVVTLPMHPTHMKSPFVRMAAAAPGSAPVDAGSLSRPAGGPVTRPVTVRITGSLGLDRDCG